MAAAASRLAGSSRLRGGVVARLVDAVPKEVADDIFGCALKRQRGVSMKHMLGFGAIGSIEKQLLTSAQFLHNELPVRLAHRVAELENLPFGLSAKPHVLKVRDWYIESFRELRRFKPIKDDQDESTFTDLLRDIYHRHRNVVPVMAMGVAELKRELRERGGFSDTPEIHSFLDGFYMSRIGIRILIGQHIALHEPPRKHQSGLIHSTCSAIQVAEDAIADARSICLRQYGNAPSVSVRPLISVLLRGIPRHSIMRYHALVYGDKGFVFPYVPSHLHHMIFELVKNSLRAVNDRFEDSDEEAPPVRVVIAQGGEDVAIKVTDEGGGIPRSGMPRIWTYLYSTAESPLEKLSAEGEGEDSPAALAGYGYGLPISRLYARYFGGDLQVISMEGYGTDAYLHINRLGNSEEPLR